jgi:protein phosphatase
VPVGQTVGDRYEVIAPQIWRDQQPTSPPSPPTDFPDVVLPYLQAHPYRLHVPGIYDVVPQRGKAPWILLENAPVNERSGTLYPTLTAQWSTAPPIRQMQWLWQLWQLWEPLSALGVASSLLDAENLRVEGWRVRLRQLITDPQPLPLAALARNWHPLAEIARPSLTTPLTQVCASLEAGSLTAEQLTVDLNYLLLKEAVPYRPRLRVAGGTHPGPNRTRNEDACYPEGELPDIPTPRLALVCDGVGGHEAGEVASQMVVRSLQPQLQGLIAESGREANPVPPAVVAQQIEAALRVVNDVISTQNDTQNRSDRQRMGTTLAMALAIPQRLKTPRGWLYTEEIYLAHVGDSRAYWITPDYCHLLTVDDDIAGRETMAGRTFYAAVRDRPEAGALTQAIGTRSSRSLTPHIQRFIVDEEGVLLLTTDGLSDQQQIESAWANYIGLITKDIITLQSAVDAFIELANQKNGHDNVAVALMRAKPLQEDAYGEGTASSTPLTEEADATDLTDASKVLLYGEADPATDEAVGGAPLEKRSLPIVWLVFIAATILGLAGFLGWWVAGQIAPTPNDSPPETVE